MSDHDEIEEMETEDSGAFDPADYENEVLALAEFLEIHPDKIIEGQNNEYEVEDGDTTYYILESDDAEKAVRKAIENTLDEMVYHYLPENLRFYFDEEKYVDDVMVDVEWAVELGYESEDEIKVHGRWYKIYSR